MKIDTATGELSADTGSKAARQSDAHALNALFMELNRVPAFRAAVQEIAADLPPGRRLELSYQMGASLNACYEHMLSRFMVTQATLWKDADHADRRCSAVREAALSATVSEHREEDYQVIDLQGVSVISAALAGMEKQGAAWDRKTGARDYASMAQMMPEVALRIIPAQGNAAGTEPAMEPVEPFKETLIEQLAGDEHARVSCRSGHRPCALPCRQDRT